MPMRRISCITLSNTFGIGIDLARDDFNEYKWWEFEIHLTIIKWYIIVRINSHV
jgi:hypothetical protein